MIQKLLRRGEESMPRAEVGVYLQRCRKATGHTQEYVAAALGVVPKTVSDWETGKYAPDSETMFRLLDLIQGDPRQVHFLFTGKHVVAPQEGDIARIVQQAIAETESEDRQQFRQALTSWIAGWRSGRHVQRSD